VTAFKPALYLFPAYVSIQVILHISYFPMPGVHKSWALGFDGS